jgi:hypothetical protein
MAFGTSFGSVLNRTRQVEEKEGWGIGYLGDMKFEIKDSEVAQSILYIFDVSPFICVYINHFLYPLMVSHVENSHLFIPTISFKWDVLPLEHTIYLRFRPALTDY